MKIYRKFITEPYSFLVNDTNFALGNIRFHHKYKLILESDETIRVDSVF